jgi:hypothetical protein
MAATFLLLPSSYGFLHTKERIKMRQDVMMWARGTPTSKIASKEYINHPGLIELVTGLDVYKHTPEAYKRAYQALGIDLINRVPLENAPEPTPTGETRPHPSKPYNYAALGIYDSVMRNSYPCATPDEVWDLDVEALHYEDLLTPVAHPCRADDIKAREEAIGEVGLYYPLLYTTLFMWGVEVLGWEVFMLAATLEPDRFHDHFLAPCAAKSQALVTELAHASSAPLIFVHDDLASGTGPVFRPSWYDDYIFPHYPEIWSEAKQLGKKIIFAADGDMTQFLPKLIEAGVDGVFLESPATPLEVQIECFGETGRFFVGGIETAKLTFGTPEEIRHMVLDLYRQAGRCPGFGIRCCGPLAGNMPLENLETYFDTRAEIGATPEDWRTCSRV